MPNDPRTPPTEGAHLTNFIRQHVERDLAEGKYAQRRWGGAPGLAASHDLDPGRIYDLRFSGVERRPRLAGTPREPATRGTVVILG